MKKFCKFLIAFILCFIFMGKADAWVPYSAIYTNEETKTKDQPLVKFMVKEVEKDKYEIFPLNRFTYEDKKTGSKETHDIDDVWTEDDIKSSSFKNKDYMYFDIVEDTSFLGISTGGRNIFYFSNKKDIDEHYDMKFEKAQDYAISEPNAIIDEMYCHYSLGQGDEEFGRYDDISFHIKREGSKVSYNVYIDHQPIFPSYIFLDYFYTGTNGTTTYKNSANIGGTEFSISRFILDHVQVTNFYNQETGVLKCNEKLDVGVDSTYLNSMLSVTDRTVSLSDTVEFGWDDSQFIFDKYKNSEEKMYSGIYVFGWEIKEDGGIPYGSKRTFSRKLILYEGSSYIKYVVGDENSSKMCMYSEKPLSIEEASKYDKIIVNYKFGLQEVSDLAGGKEYLFWENEEIDGNVYFVLDSGIIDESCNNLSEVYTNCLNGDRTASYYTTGTYVGGYGNNVKLNISTCVVSKTNFAGAEKYYLNEYATTLDGEWVENLIADDTGLRYRRYICDLKLKLKAYTTEDLLKQTTSLTALDYLGRSLGEHNILDLPCEQWNAQSSFTCTTEECKNDLYYTVNSQLRKILYYCEDIRKDLYENNEFKNETLLNARHSECTKFKEFYKSLAEVGIIDDELSGCDILTPDFKNKLMWVLNIFKIAGPIMAVILGMIDFAKVIVGEDADKEMKSAWKRFKTRLIAAALLFIVPMILSMLINIFIGEEIDNNPYCDLFEETTIK